MLLRIETVNTWVRNFRTNTPKLRMAPSHLFLVLLWGKKKKKKNGKVSFLSLLCSCLFCVSFGDFVLWTAIDCEINSAALFYDNWLASDCFVTYDTVSMKLMNVFEIGGTGPPWISFLISLGTIWTSEQLKHLIFCIACNIQGLSSVFVKHKNHVFATRSDPTAKIFSRNINFCLPRILQAGRIQ